MGQRVVRVNELVKREISDIMHTRFRNDTVAITITDVKVAPDLRFARVYYAVIGDPLEARKAGRFFARHKKEIRMILGKRIVLKYLPQLEFHFDPSIERGAKLNTILDEMGLVGDVDPEEMERLEREMEEDSL